MYPRGFTLRIGLSLTVSASLLVIPDRLLRVGDAAQSQREERKGKPKPGKPEGVWPDLEEVKEESFIEREVPPPIPSTIRAKKNSGKPWDGRRVGDPDPDRHGSEPDLVAKQMLERRNLTRRAHARARMSPTTAASRSVCSELLHLRSGTQP